MRDGISTPIYQAQKNPDWNSGGGGFGNNENAVWLWRASDAAAEEDDDCMARSTYNSST